MNALTLKWLPWFAQFLQCRLPPTHLEVVVVSPALLVARARLHCTSYLLIPPVPAPVLEGAVQFAVQVLVLALRPVGVQSAARAGDEDECTHALLSLPWTARRRTTYALSLSSPVIVWLVAEPLSRRRSPTSLCRRPCCNAARSR